MSIDNVQARAEDGRIENGLSTEFGRHPGSGGEAA